MKKDIEWLIEEIEEDIKSWGGGNPDYFRGAEDAYENVKDWLNQLDESEITLDRAFEKIAESYPMTKEEIPRHLERLVVYGEPEVLSLEWISENAVVGQYPDGMGYIVPAYKLQNLLVPKQELPVIPKFVAEFMIEKEDYMLYELFDDEWLYEEHNRVEKWLYDNDELTNKQREIDLVMARACGYVVEEEQKYVVPVAKNLYLVKSESGDLGIGNEPSEMRYEFTEQEIKDYDERYIPFMVPVEEMEG